MKMVFELDHNGDGTLTIGDEAAPIKVSNFKAEFDRPVDVVEPGHMPDEAWTRIKSGSEGWFSLSGKLIFPAAVNNHKK